MHRSHHWRIGPSMFPLAVLSAGFLSFLASSRGAEAAAPDTWAFVRVNGNNFSCSGGSVTPSAAPSSADASCSETSQGPSGVSGVGSSFADYGVLRAVGTAAVAGPSNGNATVESSAGFDETFSITGPVTRVFLKLTTSILGSGQGLAVGGGSGSSATFTAGGVVNLKAYAGSTQCTTGYVTGAGSCTILVPVNASGVVDVSVTLMAQASYATGSSAFGNATASFYSGGGLSGVEVTDASGSPLAGYTVSSASGTSYPVAPGGVAPLSTANYVRFFNLPADPSTYACVAPDGASCSGSVVAPGTNWTVNYFADASADIGVLRAKSSVFLTGDNSLGPLDGGAVPFPSLASVGGRANYRDGLWVTGAQGTGTLTLTFTITGTSSQTPGTLGRAAVQYIPIGNGLLDYAHSILAGVAPDGTATVSVPFTFNQKVEYQISFYALSQIFTGWAAGAAASADYSHTAVLTAVGVKDESGTPLDNFSIAADSGTAYSKNGVQAVVPIDVLSRINLTSRGVVPVAILSGPGFDAPAQVDVMSLTFGRTGNEHSLALPKNRKEELSEVCSVEDANDDGLPDLVCRFSRSLTAFQLGDSTGVLKGWTLAKKPIFGTDAIRIVSR
jgi:hypothetical protein